MSDVVEWVEWCALVARLDRQTRLRLGQDAPSPPAARDQPVPTWVPVMLETWEGAPLPPPPCADAGRLHDLQHSSMMPPRAAFHRHWCRFERHDLLLQPVQHLVNRPGRCSRPLAA